MIEKQDVPTLRRSSGGSQHPAKAGTWQALEEHGDGYQLHGMHIHLFLSHLYQSVDAKHLAPIRPAAKAAGYARRIGNLFAQG